LPGNTDCFATDGSTNHVCLGDDTACEGTFSGGYFSAHCFSQCDAGIPCCSALTPNFNVCPATLHVGGLGVFASCISGTCGTGDLTLCASNSQCPTGTCIPAVFNNVDGLANNVFGVCH
jgi:hypothetical protein